MTDKTEGDFTPDDLDAMRAWLESGEGGLEAKFIDNVSTIVGWFCMLVDEVQNLTGLLDHEPTGDECDDPQCAFCWPSFTCTTECDHEFVAWDEDDPAAWSFCAQCGIRDEPTQRLPLGEGYEDYCPAGNWSHDLIELGDFRADNGELIFRGEGRRICKACGEVDPPNMDASPQTKEYLDAGNAEIVPMDYGPIGLADPYFCEHKAWTTYPGGHRCNACGLWTEPEDKCPFGSHDPVAIGVKGKNGPMFVCSLCHKEFDGKPPANAGPVAPAKVTVPKEDPAPELPSPVGHKAKGWEPVERKIGPSEDRIRCDECDWDGPHEHRTITEATLPKRAVPAWDPTLYDHQLGCNNRNVRFYNSGGCKCPAYRPGTPDDEETPFTAEGMSDTDRMLALTATAFLGFVNDREE